MAQHVLALASVWACLACEKPQPTAAPRSAETTLAAATVPAAPAPVSAKLPRDEGPYYPSLLRTHDNAAIDVPAYADVKACATCHAAAVAQWSSSAHAHASFDNPWYRASVDALRKDVSYTASRHCAGCHDPLPLLAGKMEHEIAPADPLAAVGVTCLVCHSVEKATTDGNASFTLSNAAVPIPVEGDPASLQRHRDRLALPALRTPALCASCHRGFLGRHTGIGHHLSGMDEPGAWRASSFGGSRANTLEPVAAQSCNDCHLRDEPVLHADVSAHDGVLHSHRFAGGHTAIAALSGDGAQHDAIVAQLRSSVRLDLPVVRLNGKPYAASDPLPLGAGDKLALDVTVRSTGVGHQFPGGLKDIQDTWLELDVRDARGRSLFRAGDSQARREDPSAYQLRAMVVDTSGNPETRHLVTHLGTVAYDHTVPALGARTIRYELQLSAAVSAPLSVRARIQHRKHRLDARELACEATRSARGRAFAAAARQRGERVLDGCAAEPITEVAAATFAIGPQPSASERPLWSRLYDHALGLSSGLQEQLDDARSSADRALHELSFLEDSADVKSARANLLCLLGRISARQGRLEEALTKADQAEALVGIQPAILRVRADAYMSVWRWPEAATTLAQLTASSPFDTAAHRDLARARYSAHDHAGALQAAQAGMQLQPRDEGLLRTQALALQALGSPEAKAARDAFVFYRDADETTASKLACDRMTTHCNRDRMPVVTLLLSSQRP
ncbi:MAG: multiheme c-type cytochrome [Polyangiales bacterium]